MLPALGRIAHAIPLSRVPCPLHVRPRNIPSLQLIHKLMNHAGHLSVFLLAGLILLGCRSARHSQRDSELTIDDSLRYSTVNRTDYQVDTYTHRAEEVDGSWWLARIKFDTTAMPDSLGRYPVSEVELHGSRQMALSREQEETHAEAVDVTQTEAEEGISIQADSRESTTIEPVHGRHRLVYVIAAAVIALLYILYRRFYSHATGHTSK